MELFLVSCKKDGETFNIGVFDEEHIGGVLYIAQKQYGSENVFSNEITINKVMF